VELIMLKLIGAIGLLLVAIYLFRGGSPSELATLITDMLGAAWTNIPAPAPGGAP
jgi:hypothetical protein